MHYDEETESMDVGTKDQIAHSGMRIMLMP